MAANGKSNTGLLPQYGLVGGETRYIQYVCPSPPEITDKHEFKTRVNSCMYTTDEGTLEKTTLCNAETTSEHIKYIHYMSAWYTLND
jgi:hypothetical protein